jgi:hypothetical protein
MLLDNAEVTRCGGCYFIGKIEIAEYAPRMRKRQPAWGVRVPWRTEVVYFKTKEEAFAFVAGLRDQVLRG